MVLERIEGGVAWTTYGVLDLALADLVLSQSCGHSTWAQGSLTSMPLGLLPQAFYLQLSNQSPGFGNLIPDF